MDIEKPHGRHSKYYATDSLVFLVDDQLFRISGDLLRQGQHFRDMLDNPDIGGAEQGKTDDNPIILDSKLGVSASDLESFLEVLTSSQWHAKLPKTWSSWAQALRLATMWSFTDLKNFIINEMEVAPGAAAIDPFKWLCLADQNDVPAWLPRAFMPLCQRKEFLSIEEGTKLGTRRLMAVCHVRERFRDPKAECGMCKLCGRLGWSEKTLDHYYKTEADLFVVGI